MGHIARQSTKFKRVSLNETLEFPFWGLLCRFLIKENMKKLNKKIHNKNIDIHKTA